MPRRAARIYPRGKDESVREYEKGILNLDRPTWKAPQAQDMERRYALINDELAEVRRKAVIAIRRSVGTALVPSYLRAVLKAWKLAKLEVPQAQYKAELNYVIEKNRLDRATVNKILQELGLPTA